MRLARRRLTMNMARRMKMTQTPTLIPIAIPRIAPAERPPPLSEDELLELDESELYV